MAPKTEGFSLPAAGSSPSLFVATPVTTTASTATGGTSQANAVAPAVPLFAFLPVQENCTDGPKTNAQPLFIIGEPPRCKPRVVRRRSIAFRPSCSTHKVSGLEKPETMDCDNIIQKSEIAKPVIGKTCAPSADVCTSTGNQSSTLPVSSKPQIVAPPLSKISLGDMPKPRDTPAESDAVSVTETVLNTGSKHVVKPAVTSPQPPKVKNLANAFSFNPNRHKLNSRGSLGKAHSIDFLAKPATSPISRSNSNGSTSTFSFKPNAAGAFANATAINMASFSFKPHKIVSIENNPKVAFGPSPVVSRKDSKSAVSTFSFKPNALGTVANLPTANVDYKPALFASSTPQDAIPPFSFKPSTSAPFGSAPTFNFVYNPTHARCNSNRNRIPMFAFKARASSGALNAGCVFGNNATVFGQNADFTHGFSFNPESRKGNVRRRLDVFPSVRALPVQSTFSFGNNEAKSAFQCSAGERMPKPEQKLFRQSPLGYLFSPNKKAAHDSSNLANSTDLFSIGSTLPTQTAEAMHSNANCESSAAPRQQFSFGVDNSQVASLSPARGANPYVVQIQNGGMNGAGSGDGTQTISVSQTNSPKPCVSINANNNLVIQISADSIQVIISSAANT